MDERKVSPFDLDEDTMPPVFAPTLWIALREYWRDMAPDVRAVLVLTLGFCFPMMLLTFCGLAIVVLKWSWWVTLLTFIGGMIGIVILAALLFIIVAELRHWLRNRKWKIV